MFAVVRVETLFLNDQNTYERKKIRTLVSTLGFLVMIHMLEYD